MAVQAQHQQQFLENPSSLLFYGSGGSNNNNNSLEWFDSGGGAFPGVFYRSLQQQQLLQQHMMAVPPSNNQLLPMGYSSPSSTSLVPMDFSRSMAWHMEKQKQEIYQFLSLQNERLRIAVQQQRKQHLVSLMRSLESKASSMLRQKEEEIAKSSKKTMELEECLRRAEIENQSWQQIAKENEAMALVLSSTLQQLHDNHHKNTNGCFSSAGPPGAAAEDAASCCDSAPGPSNPKNGTGEEETMVGMGACKGCSSRDSCMLFLPCMHLCSCKSCEGLLNLCPVCRSVKEGSIEVFLV